MTNATQGGSQVPWQLQMFSRTLKKQQKLRLLLDLAGPLEGQRCLLITNGDNNGALNYHFRAAGGDWSWGELEPEGIADIARLLEEPVQHVDWRNWPYADGEFQRLVVIDAHEHLGDVEPFNREIARVLAPGGRAVITVPNGDTRLPVAVLKRLIGMGPAQYGHIVQGYRTDELEEMMREVGLEPERTGAYARFFTEFAELAINFGYVKILARRSKGSAVSEGTIAPSSEEQLRAVRKTYRMYSLIYPFVKAFSSLDAVIPGDGGYAVAVAARKPA